MSFLNVINKKYIITIFTILQDSFGPATQEDVDDIQIKDALAPQNIEENKCQNVENENTINKIINLKLKFFFTYISHLYKQRQNLYKAQIFSYLKYYPNKGKEKPMDQKEINKMLMTQIIFHKIENSSKNIYYIYKVFRYRKKIKYFELWKRYAFLCKTLDSELNLKNSYDKKINELNKQIKDMNKRKDILKQDENKINSSVQKKEEQKIKCQKNIKNLTTKCKKLQKEKEINKNGNNIMNVKNTNNSSNNVNINTNSTKKKESEEKRMELESNLRQMKEEDLMNDKNFKNFVNTFENNLNYYESKAQEILRQKRQKSLEISKADYDTNNNPNNNANINLENYKGNGKLYE